MIRELASGLVAPGVIDQVIHTVYDLEGRRIAEYEVGGSAPVLLRECIWMGWTPVAVIEGGEIYYIRTDHIDRPVFATDENGVEVWNLTYTPFGEVYTETTPNTTIRFPGQWFQSESGLHQNWMRDYDPSTGRYIQADPLGLVDGASVYGYALQNPGRYDDPMGLDACYTDIKTGQRVCLKSSDTYCPSGDCGWRNPTDNVHPESEYAVCKRECEDKIDLENWMHGPHPACKALGLVAGKATRSGRPGAFIADSLCIDMVCTEKCATQCGMY